MGDWTSQIQGAKAEAVEFRERYVGSRSNAVKKKRLDHLMQALGYFKMG